jgi:hypothetical protein
MGWMRRPKSQNEKVQNAAPEVREFVRGKRTPRNLADAYDDETREKQRNWKFQRRGRKAWDR